MHEDLISHEILQMFALLIRNPEKRIRNDRPCELTIEAELLAQFGTEIRMTVENQTRIAMGQIHVITHERGRVRLLGNAIRRERYFMRPGHGKREKREIGAFRLGKAPPSEWYSLAQTHRLLPRAKREEPEGAEGKCLGGHVGTHFT